MNKLNNIRDSLTNFDNQMTEPEQEKIILSIPGMPTSAHNSTLTKKN